MEYRDQAPTLPQINIGGTSAAYLVEQQGNVLGACLALRRALRDASPHGRDYPSGEAAYSLAVAEHGIVVAAVNLIMARAQIVAEHCAEHVTDDN